MLVEHLADETVVYDERSSEAHCLSPLAAVVFANCDGETTIQQLAVLASERVGEPVDEAGVIEALTQLQERDLLAVPPRGDLTRRQMIGKTAAATAGVAFSAPLITSIVAPAAVAAASATCDIVLCCPCCTDSSLNKDNCCTTPLTVNCQCVQASQGERVGPDGMTIISGGKFCKTTGTSAPTDAECINTINPPASWSKNCTPNVKGAAACGTCGT